MTINRQRLTTAINSGARS